MLPCCHSRILFRKIKILLVSIKKTEQKRRQSLTFHISQVKNQKLDLNPPLTEFETQQAYLCLNLLTFFHHQYSLLPCLNNIRQHHQESKTILKGVVNRFYPIKKFTKESSIMLESHYWKFVLVQTKIQPKLKFTLKLNPYVPF